MLFRSRSLATVHCCIAFRVVAHQHLAKGRREGLDVAREVVAELELEVLEVVQPARLGGAQVMTLLRFASRRMYKGWL